VSPFVAHRRAISSFATPSAANNNARAWTTLRCANDDDLAITPNALRCSADIDKGGAAINIMMHPNLPHYFNDGPLDGGKPCLVHHDLPWNPARLSQRWGRAVRASSGFQAVAPQDIFVPVLDTEVDRRIYETVRGRWEVGDLLLPKKSGYDENDDGHGAIPVELLRGVAGIWRLT